MRAIGTLVVAVALVAAGQVQGQTTAGKKSLTLEGAKGVAAAAAAEAKRGNEGGSIAIVDDGGNLMNLERIQPTFPMGAHIATCPFAVLQQLARHPLTDVGLERFLADWKKAKR